MQGTSYSPGRAHPPKLVTAVWVGMCLLHVGSGEWCGEGVERLRPFATNRQ